MYLPPDITERIAGQNALHQQVQLQAKAAGGPTADQHYIRYLRPYQQAAGNLIAIGRKLELKAAVELLNPDHSDAVQAVVLKCEDKEGKTVVLKVGEPASQGATQDQWAKAGVPTPAVIAYGQEPTPYVLTEFAHGVRLDQHLIESNAIRVHPRIVKDVIKALVRIHDVAPTPSILEWPDRTEVIDAHLRITEAWVPQVPTEYFELASSIHGQSWEMVGSHCDIGAHNLLVDKSGRFVRSIIDGSGAAMPSYFDVSTTVAQLSTLPDLVANTQTALDAYPTLDPKILDVWVAYQVLRIGAPDYIDELVELQRAGRYQPVSLSHEQLAWLGAGLELVNHGSELRAELSSRRGDVSR